MGGNKKICFHSMALSVSLCLYLSLCLSVSLCPSVSLCLSLSLSLFLFFSLSLFLSLFLSLSLSLSLSLEQCCKSETKKFESLNTTFLSDDEKYSIDRFKRLSTELIDPLTEVRVAFFSAALPITIYNKSLQRNDTLPHMTKF